MSNPEIRVDNFKVMQREVTEVKPKTLTGKTFTGFSVIAINEQLSRLTLHFDEYCPLSGVKSAMGESLSISFQIFPVFLMPLLTSLVLMNYKAVQSVDTSIDGFIYIHLFDYHTFTFVLTPGKG